MNYLICEKNHFTHFFYLKNKGICYRVKKGSHFGDTVILYKEGLSGFSVYCDHNFNLHLICTNNKNEVVYFSKKNDIWTHFVLSKANDNLIPMQFKISEFGGFISFFYSALYKNTVLLIHCILSPGAMPEVISELLPSAPYFNTSYGRIYYTTSDNILGFKDFSDGKCGIFSPVTNNGIMPFSAILENTEYICFKKNNKIFLNTNELFIDSLATFPIICSKENKITVMWKSNSFVRYITSFNNGATWSAPMRFINNGLTPELFTVSANCQENVFYGHSSKTGLTLY